MKAGLRFSNVCYCKQAVITWIQLAPVSALAINFSVIDKWGLMRFPCIPWKLPLLLRAVGTTRSAAAPGTFPNSVPGPKLLCERGALGRRHLWFAISGLSHHHYFFQSCYWLQKILIPNSPAFSPLLPPRQPRESRFRRFFGVSTTSESPAPAQRPNAPVDHILVLKLASF